MILRGVLIWLLLTVSCASALAHWTCTTQESTCKLVFVVHDTGHAAIVLLKSDIALDFLPELDYFPDPNAGIFTGIKAAFWSSGSVLHVVGFSGDVQSFYRSGEVVQLRLAADAHARLLEYTSDTFSRPQPNGRAQASPGLVAYSRFYPATRKFSLLRTCNTWVAEALKSAGLPVSPGHVMTAGSLATQLSGIEVRE